MGAFLVAALCAAAEAQGENIVVRAGGDLQAAINAARPGDVILLQAGATFSGNFVLPDKGATTVDITIRSDSDSRLPAPGTRIGPAHAPLLATLRSPNTLAALTAVPRSHHWRLELLAFVANARGFGEIIALGSGDADQNDLSLVPHHLTLDRLLILGDPLIGQKRGIALNSASTTISNSHIADCKGAGFDTQAIGGWNGPGPYKITNNYLEGAGENFMLGGASPKIRDMIPADITFTRNYLTKPLAWKLPILQTPSAVTAAGSSGGSLAAGTYYYFVVAALPTAQDSWAWSAKSASVSATVGNGGQVTITWNGDAKAKVYRVYRGTAPGTADRFFDSPGTTFVDTGSLPAKGMDTGAWIRASVWTVKNLFELKEGERVLVDGNVFEHVWQESQNGYAILFTPRNQDNTSPWVAVRDLTFSNNIVRHAGAGIQVLAYDDVASGSSQRTERVHIVNNVFDDVGSTAFPGAGRFLLIAHGPSDVRVDHNTVIQSTEIAYAYGERNGVLETAANFVFTNNLVRHNTYGINGDSRAAGNSAITGYFPASTITRNGIACSGSSSCSAGNYPAGNVFMAAADWQAQFASFATGDYRLIPESVFRDAGTDGKSLGADLDAIAAAGSGGISAPRAPGKPTGVIMKK